MSTGNIPKSALMTTNPVQEKYGWIWVFIGDSSPGELPSLPHFPQVESSDLRSINGEFQ